MKTRLVVVLLSFCAITFAQNNAPIISTRVSGGFADGTFTINGYIAHISINQNPNGQPLLIYNYVFVSADGSHIFEFGGGYIPNDAFTINNGNVASLNVDTSQVAGFFASSCVSTSSGPTCSSGPFGVMQMDWHKDGDMTDRSKSEDWKTFPGARLHTQLTTTLDSASFTGSFLGNSFTSDLGDIGTNTNSLFEIFQN
jgi:hypothetical protein